MNIRLNVKNEVDRAPALTFNRPRKQYLDNFNLELKRQILFHIIGAQSPEIACDRSEEENALG